MRNKHKRIVKRFIILGVIAMLLVATGFVLHVARNRSKDRLLREHLETGMAAYEAGDFETAAEKLGYYNAAINTNPDVAYTLADSYKRLPMDGGEGVRKAAQFARVASELAPDRPEPLELLVELYGRLGQQTERLQTAERLIALDPDNTEAWTAKARSQVALGQRDAALLTAQELVSLTPNDTDAHRLVLAILAGGDLGVNRQRVIAYAEELGRTHPDDPSFTVLRVQVMDAMGDEDEARAIASGLVDADLDAETLVDAVRVLDLLGMRAESDALIARHADKPELYQQTALLIVKRLAMSGRLEEAAQMALAALDAESEASPEIVPWAFVSGVTLSKARIDALLEGEADSPYLRAMADGFLALNRGEPLESRDAFERAFALRSDDPLAGAMLADVLDRIGAWKDAARMREEILRRTPEFLSVRLVHVESLLGRQRPIEADRVIREGIRIDPNNGALLLAHLYAVRDLVEAGRARPEEIRGSIRLAQAFDDSQEGITPATIPLAQLMLASNQQTALDEVLSRLASADPRELNARALLGLADMMEAAGHPRTGEIYEIIDRAAGLDPYVILERAMALADAGDARAGRDLIEQKIESAGENAQLGLQMARAAYLDSIGDPEARDVISDLSERHTSNPSIQLLTLESRSAWSDNELVSKAIGRLRAITGDDATGWKIQEARRKLIFEPTGENAASVVTMLGVSTAERDPVSQLVLADAMSILGDEDEAANHLERAIDAGLEEPRLLLRLIAIRQSRGEIDAARRWAVVLSRLEPVTDDIRRERTSALARLGMFDTASADAAILAQSTSPRDLILAASIAAQNAESAEASRRLDKLVALPTIPDEALPITLITLVDAGRAEDAKAILERERPSNETVDFLLAEAAFLEQTGQVQEAGVVLENAVKRTRDLRLLSAQARLLARLGRTEEALAATQTGLELDPENAELTIMRDAIGLLDASSGAQLASGGSAANRKVVEAIRKYAVETPDREALIQRLRGITTEEPTSYTAWSVLVTQLQAAGRLQEAIESAQTAMRLIPSDARAARLTVDAMLLTDEPRGAMAAAQEWARRARGSREESYQAETTLAALHARLGSNASAIRALEPWAERIKTDPDANPILVRLLATMRIIAGRQDEAWDILSRRIEQDPRWLASAIEIARDVIQRGGSAEASRAWLDRVSSAWSGEPEDVLRQAQARLDIASRTGSESDFLSVIETIDALDAMESGVDVVERGSTLLRIESERQLGRVDEAARRARVLAAERPNDPMAKSLASVTMIETEGDAAEAVDLASQAVRLAEGNPRGRFELTTALDALGRAQLASGEPEEAEKSFRRASALQNGPGSAQIGLAEALAAQDRTDEASRVLRDPDLLDRVRVSPILARRHEALRNRLQQVR